MKDKNGNVYKMMYHCCYIVRLPNDAPEQRELLVPLDEPLTGLTQLAILRGACAITHDVPSKNISFTATPQLLGYTMNGMPYIPKLERT